MQIPFYFGGAAMRLRTDVSIVAFSRSASRAVGAAALCAAILQASPAALAQDLSSYAVLAGSTITNTGTTTINGNIGLSPGTAFTGQGPGADQIVLTDGTIHIADAVAVQAKSDLTTAFNVLMGRPATALVGDLGGRTLTEGVYSFASSAQMTGTLTLDGGPDSIFIIQVGSSLTTATSSAVLLTGGAQASNVFFVVGESATLGTTTAFVGQILAGTSITLNTAATILCGAALTQTGAVTLDTNTINVCTFTTEPEDLTEILGDDITDTGGSILTAIDDYVTDGGTLPLSFQLLALLSPTELAEALEQMSGEAGGGVAPAGMQGMDSFLDLLGSGPGGGMSVVTGHDQPVSGGTVSVMGYAPSVPQAGGDAFADFDAVPMSRPGDWTVWAAGFGGRSQVDGDIDAGTHDRATNDFGVAFGVERQVTEDLMFGLAVSGGGTNFDLADSLGSGDTAMLQAAAYARSDFDQAYLAASVAVGVHRVSLDRFLSFAGDDHFTADYNATGFAGEIEAGYHIGWLTPYAALRGQSFSTPAYSEETASGASTFALDYEANTATSLRSEVGARADWSMPAGEDGTLTLHAGAAWLHEIRSDSDLQASFQALPGSTFDVEGATSAPDSLLASLGAQLDMGNGVGLGASVSGEYAANAMSYGGKASLSYSW
jgi:outer membrane autotransporter protein